MFWFHIDVKWERKMMAGVDWGYIRPTDYFGLNMLNAIGRLLPVPTYQVQHLGQ